MWVLVMPAPKHPGEFVSSDSNSACVPRPSVNPREAGLSSVPYRKNRSLLCRAPRRSLPSCSDAHVVSLSACPVNESCPWLQLHNSFRVSPGPWTQCVMFYLVFLFVVQHHMRYRSSAARRPRPGVRYLAFEPSMKVTGTPKQAAVSCVGDANCNCSGVRGKYAVLATDCALVVPLG